MNLEALTPEYLLSLTSNELASTVQALYNEIRERILWAMEKGHWYRDRPIEEAQLVLTNTVNAYLKALNVLKGSGEPLTAGFLKTFTIEEDLWRALDHMTTATSWEEIPAS
jgi:hypothetical protein